MKVLAQNGMQTCHLYRENAAEFEVTQQNSHGSLLETSHCYQVF
jgi:hypothetical protein